MSEIISGFSGGSTIYRLGSRYDLKLFFILVREQCSLNDRENYLINRLRVSYVKYSDMKDFKELLSKIGRCFKSIPILSIVEEINIQKSALEWNKETLFEVFYKYFSSLTDAYEDCEYIFTSSKRGGGARNLIRSTIANIPIYDWFGNISLEYYDSMDLEGKALWEQEVDYIEAVYNANRLK